MSALPQFAPMGLKTGDSSLTTPRGLRVQVDTSSSSFTSPTNRGPRHGGFSSVNSNLVVLQRYNRILSAFDLPSLNAAGRKKDEPADFEAAACELSSDTLVDIICKFDSMIASLDMSQTMAVENGRTPKPIERLPSALVKRSLHAQMSQQFPVHSVILPGEHHTANLPMSVFSSVTSVPEIPELKYTDHLEEGEDDMGWLQINEYQVLNDLGRGSYGTVRLACDSNGEPVAMKSVPKSNLTNASDDQIRSEIAVMKKLKHRNIVQLKEVIDDPSSNMLYMIMQYVDRGELLNQVAKKAPGEPPRFTPLDPDIARSYMKQLIDAVRYTHRRGVAHRDIKPSNVLLSSEGRVYLADFGVSHIFDRKEDTQVSISAGTPAFMAPEVYSGSQYDAKAADVWALGATFYTMIYGRFPFNGNTHFQYRDAICKEEPEFDPVVVDEEIAPPSRRASDDDDASREIGTSVTLEHIPDEDPEEQSRTMRPGRSFIDSESGAMRSWDVPEDIIKLLEKMLNKDPKKRLSIDECSRQKGFATTTRLRGINMVKEHSREEGKDSADTEAKEEHLFSPRATDLQRAFSRVTLKRNNMQATMDSVLPTPSRRISIPARRASLSH